MVLRSPRQNWGKGCKLWGRGEGGERGETDNFIRFSSNPLKGRFENILNRAWACYSVDCIEITVLQTAIYNLCLFSPSSSRCSRVGVFWCIFALQNLQYYAGYMDFLVSSLAEHYPPGKLLNFCTAVKNSVKYPQTRSRWAWIRRRRVRPRWGRGRPGPGTDTSAESAARSSSMNSILELLEMIKIHYIEGPRRSCSVTSSPNTDIMTTGKCDAKIWNKSKIHLHLQ